MIPSFVNIGSVWNVLPPGIHDATLDEVEKRFATNEHRRWLFEGFKKAARTLRLAGCRTIFLDGSFVTEKELPDDYDACWISARVEVNRLDPVLLDFSDRRRAQKQKYFGEFFPAFASATPGAVFWNSFKRTDTRASKKE